MSVHAAQVEQKCACSSSLLHSRTRIRMLVGKALQFYVLTTSYHRQLLLQGCEVGSSTERTRTSITNSLKKKLADLMQEFTALRNNIVNQYRDVVDRRCSTLDPGLNHRNCDTSATSRMCTEPFVLLRFA